MPNKTLTYQEALSIVQTNLDVYKKDRKLKSFCLYNNLNYNTVTKLLNPKTTKLYPNLVATLLVLFGYKIESHSISFILSE